jgi:hypothetical protein
MPRADLNQALLSTAPDKFTKGEKIGIAFGVVGLCVLLVLVMTGIIKIPFPEEDDGSADAAAAAGAAGAGAAAAPAAPAAAASAVLCTSYTCGVGQHVASAGEIPCPGGVCSDGLCCSVLASDHNVQYTQSELAGLDGLEGLVDDDTLTPEQQLTASLAVITEQTRLFEIASCDHTVINGVTTGQYKYRNDDQLAACRACTPIAMSHPSAVVTCSNATNSTIEEPVIHTNFSGTGTIAHQTLRADGSKELGRQPVTNAGALHVKCMDNYYYHDNQDSDPPLSAQCSRVAGHTQGATALPCTNEALKQYYSVWPAPESSGTCSTCPSSKFYFKPSYSGLPEAVHECRDLSSDGGSCAVFEGSDPPGPGHVSTGGCGPSLACNHTYKCLTTNGHSCETNTDCYSGDCGWPNYSCE